MKKQPPKPPLKKTTKLTKKSPKANNSKKHTAPKPPLSKRIWQACLILLVHPLRLIFAGLGILVVVATLWGYFVYSRPTISWLASSGNPTQILTFEISNAGIFTLSDVSISCWMPVIIFDLDGGSQTFGGVTIDSMNKINPLRWGDEATFSCDATRFLQQHGNIISLHIGGSHFLSDPFAVPPGIKLRSAELYIKVKYHSLLLPRDYVSDVFRYVEFPDGTHGWETGEAAD